MKIMVGIKSVIDPHMHINIKRDGSDVEKSNMKMSINPFDENALEEAIRLKEAGLADEVVAVSIYSEPSQEVLRKSLAFGADRAIFVKCEEELGALAVAKILKKLVEKEKPRLVILGKQSVDLEQSQTGQMLAALLNWPQGTFASQLSITEDYVTVVRKIDEGLETLKLILPAVITAELRLNEPRYITLPNIMKARQKPLEIINIKDLNIDVSTNLKTIKVELPAPRTPGIKLKNARELIDKLKNEAKVI